MVVALAALGGAFRAAEATSPPVTERSICPAGAAAPSTCAACLRAACARPPTSRSFGDNLCAGSDFLRFLGTAACISCSCSSCVTMLHKQQSVDIHWAGSYILIFSEMRARRAAASARAAAAARAS